MLSSSPVLFCVSLFHHTTQVRSRTKGRSSLCALSILFLSHLAVVSASAQNIRLVQTSGNSNDSASASVSQSFPSSNTSGNLIVVVASWGSNQAPSISARDTLGNSYFVATRDWSSGNNQGLAILYAPNIRAGANVVTVDLGHSDAWRRIIVCEYAGLSVSSPLDAAAKNQASAATTANSVTSAAGTTTTNGDLIFGAVMDDSGSFPTISPGTGFARRAFLNNMDTAIEDAVQTTAGPKVATFTFTLRDHYLAQMVAFRPAGSGAGGTSASLSSLACSPAAVIAGGASSCVVTLTQSAPATGSTVSLSSNNSGVSVPPSITVPAGSTSSNFTATAGTFTSTQSVTLTATYSGTSKSAVLTVTPPSTVSVTVSPSNSNVPVGQAAQFTATVQNDAQNLGVTWNVSGSACSGTACGTLSNATPNSVTYTAPAAVPGSTVILTATSKTDTNRSSSATITITVTPNTGAPATPRFVQGVSHSNVQGTAISSYIARLPNPTLSGNCIVVFLEYSLGHGASAISVTDDKGNMYLAAFPQPGVNDGNQGMQIFYATNVKPDAQNVTVSWSGGTPTYDQVQITEWYNIALASALDGTSANSNTGGSSSGLNAGTFAPSANGDLILNFAINDDPGYVTGGWSPGTGFTPIFADLLDGTYSQFAVQPSAAAINPSATMSPAGSWLSAAIALKAASAGTPPPSTGIRIVRIQHNSFFNIASFNGSSVPLQFPSSGDLMVAAIITNQGYNVSGISDSGSNNWQPTGPVETNSAGGDCQMYYTASATTSSDLRLTVAFSGAVQKQSNILLFDVEGAAASPFDTRATNLGSQNVSGTLSTGSVTPSTSNGLVIAEAGFTSNTATGVSPGNFESANTAPEFSDNPVNQNNGWAHVYNKGTSPLSFSWTVGGGPVGNWTFYVTCWMAASAP